MARPEGCDEHSWVKKFIYVQDNVFITVISLAPICSSPISTMFPELNLMQRHTARKGKIRSREYAVLFLGPFRQILL